MNADLFHRIMYSTVYNYKLTGIVSRTSIIQNMQRRFRHNCNYGNCLHTNYDSPPTDSNQA